MAELSGGKVTFEIPVTATVTFGEAVRVLAPDSDLDSTAEPVDGALYALFGFSLGTADEYVKRRGFGESCTVRITGVEVEDIRRLKHASVDGKRIISVLAEDGGIGLTGAYGHAYDYIWRHNMRNVWMQTVEIAGV